MNFVWIAILTISLGVLTTNSANTAFSTILNGSHQAVELAKKLWAIYAVWLGVLKIVEDSGLDKKLAKLFMPILRKLMGRFDPYTENQIAINITSNLLGMGNASTPSGINAIYGMYNGGQIATTAMIMFFILNTTNLQIIPTTIISLRVLNGSTSANDIIFPTIIASFVSTATGILLVIIISKLLKKIKKSKS